MIVMKIVLFSQYLALNDIPDRYPIIKKTKMYINLKPSSPNAKEHTLRVL